MCSGAELLLLAAAGAGVSAYGTIQSANAQADALEDQANMANQEAAERREQAAKNAEIIRRQAMRQRGAARAAAAASGVDTGAGSALVIDENIAAAGENDAFAELLTGGRQAGRMDQQARAFRKSAGSTRRSGLYSAAGSLLSSAAGYSAATYSPYRRPSMNELRLYEEG